jgi:hypothetical protein
VSDPWQEPSAQAWIRHVAEEMVPKLAGSAVVISIVPGDPEDLDLKFCVELGASIMLGKPIVATVFGDRAVPPKLAAVADEIVHLPEGATPDGSDQLRDAIERVLKADES